MMEPFTSDEVHLRIPDRVLFWKTNKIDRDHLELYLIPARFINGYLREQEQPAQNTVRV
jgi:hypothetical protein